MKRTYKEAVKIAVDWWAEKSFDTAVNQNNGDNSPLGGFAFALMNTVSIHAQKEVTPEMVEKFKSRLTETLIAAESENRFSTYLDVDYEPNEKLREAAAFSGISTALFPCKTFTKITDTNEVEGSYQYGGAFFKL